MVRVLGDLGGLVVADVAVEGGDLHEVGLQVGLDPLGVGLDAVGAVGVEGDAGVTQELDGLQDAPGHDRLEDVELEVALGSGEADGGVVAEDLRGHHGHGLALGGVDLAGHDRAAGLVLRDDELADAVAGAGGVPAHVVGDLHEGVGQDAQGAGDLNQGIVGAQGGEEVVRLGELDAGLLGDLLGAQGAEVRVGVEAGADGGPADGELTGAGVGVADAIEGEVDLGDPPADDLPQGDGGGVLQVGAPHHDDVGVGLGLGVQGVAQLLDARVHGGQLVDDGDVHGRGEGVVGGLAAVDVVVGVDRGLGAELAAGKLDGAVGDDLVGVHVGLGARAGLEDHERELGVEVTGDDLIAGLGDELGDVGGQLAELGVGQGGGLLEDPQGLDHGAAPHEGLAADVEVVQAPLGLGPPVAVGVHLDGAHGVGFGAGRDSLVGRLCISCHRCKVRRSCSPPCGDGRPRHVSDRYRPTSPKAPHTGRSCSRARSSSSARCSLPSMVRGSWR